MAKHLLGKRAIMGRFFNAMVAKLIPGERGKARAWVGPKAFEGESVQQDASATEGEPLMVTHGPAADDLRWAIRRVIVIALVGACYLAVLRIANVDQPDRSSVLIFFRLFCLGEPVPIGLLGAFAVISWWYLERSSQTLAIQSDATSISIIEVAGMAAVVSVVVSAVALALLDDYAFSMDEFGAVFQARLFADGRVSASVPAEWRRQVEAISPVFVSARQTDSAWVSLYLPGNAAIRAPFERAGVGWLSGVVLALVCVGAISGVARTLWPNQRVRHLLAVGVLALSTQFLVVAGTPYAMTAHLAVNLCWLLVWVRGGRAAYLAGPIGMFGILLHQPVPHLLFAAPFGIRLLRDRQWRLAMWMGLWYVSALLLSAAWHNFVGFTAATGGLISALAAPRPISWLVAVMHAVLLATWQTPIAALAFVVSLRRVRTLRPLEQDLVFGLALSLVFYLFFKLITQGHGWGWRYGHQVLGNVALLCAAVWPTFEQALGSSRARRLAIASFVVTITVQFPLRARLVQNVTAPFATAYEWLRAQDADVVIVPNDSIWYGRDLVRNKPGLPRPVVVFGSYAADPKHAFSPPSSAARVRRISVSELTALGLEAVPVDHRPAVSFPR